jgi:disulfide bond formation protein DsbB
VFGVEDATAVHRSIDSTSVLPAAVPPVPPRQAPASAPLPPKPGPTPPPLPSQAPPPGGPTDKPWGWLGKLVYWGFVGWILAYCGVLLGAFTVQLLQGEFPCPLCMLQRYAMILSSLAALWIVMQARRGTLTMGRYAQGIGMGLLAALAGSVMSGRQVLLHILPGDPGYGSAVLGLHLYTWALITFFIVAVFCALALLLMPKAVATAPGPSWLGRFGGFITMVVVWLFLFLIAANVLAIILLEGVAWVLPDDPTSYNLLDQLGITGS